MPYYENNNNTEYLRKMAETKRQKKEKKRKHAEVVLAWKERRISWNEYIRLEKKYRTD